MIKLNGDKLWQYDLDRTIEIIPSKGRTVEMVRFIRGRRPYMLAHREEDGKIIADIPNVLLKAFGNVLCIVDYLDEDGHIITENSNLHVHKREKPADYQYKETDTLEIGEGGSTSSGGGTQADWNAAEGEPGYILNKPFGETEEFIIPETKYTFSDMEGLSVAGESNLALLIPGETYTVKYNGVPYTCTVIIMQGTTAMFGNLSIAGGDDTGEPFACTVSYEDVAGCMIVALDGSSEATISISKNGVKQIDSRFIPCPVFDLASRGFGKLGISPSTSYSGMTVSPVVLEQLKECMEYGILRIRMNVSYTGGNPEGTSDSLTYDNEPKTIVATFNKRIEDADDLRDVYSAIFENVVLHITLDYTNGSVAFSFSEL